MTAELAELEAAGLPTRMPKPEVFVSTIWFGMCFCVKGLCVAGFVGGIGIGENTGIRRHINWQRDARSHTTHNSHVHSQR